MSLRRGERRGSGEGERGEKDIDRVEVSWALVRNDQEEEEGEEEEEEEEERRRGRRKRRKNVLMCTVQPLSLALSEMLRQSLCYVGVDQ